MRAAPGVPYRLSIAGWQSGNSFYNAHGTSQPFAWDDHAAEVIDVENPDKDTLP
jgi:hypothetical protein